MQGGKSLDQLHNQGLASLSQSLDGFMRTPAFLEVLKQSLKRMIDLKLMQDQMAQTVSQQTGLPMAADVTGVFERVHSAEQTILKQLAKLDDRLQGHREDVEFRPGREEPEKEKSNDKGRQQGRCSRRSRRLMASWSRTETSGYP